MLLRVLPEGAGTAPLGNGASLPSGAVTPRAPVWIPADDFGGGLRVWPDPPRGLGEGVPVGDGVRVGVGEGVPVGDGVRVGVGEGVPVGDGVRVGVGEGVPVGDGVPVGVGDGDPLGEGDGEPAAGSNRKAAEIECGRACPVLAAA